jgi:hypothetical protein
VHTDASPQSFVDDPAFGAELDELDRGLTDGVTGCEPPEAAAPDDDQPAPTRLLRRLREMSPAPPPASEPVTAAVSVPDSVPDALLDSVPASIFVQQARENAASAAPPESRSSQPAFLERLGTTLDDLDHLAVRSRGASVADELGIPERVPPHEGALSADDPDQTITGPSTFGTIVTRTARVALFIACLGLGGLAAAFVFHDRLVQLQLF